MNYVWPPNTVVKVHYRVNHIISHFMQGITPNRHSPNNWCKVNKLYARYLYWRFLYFLFVVHVWKSGDVVVEYMNRIVVVQRT